MVQASLRREETPDASWAAALLGMWSAAPGSSSIDRALDRLHELTLRGTASAAQFNDMAAAYFIRAGEHGDARDLFAALDYAETAFARDSMSSQIRFNRAVILEHARMDWQARAAWRGVAESARGDWRREAQDRSSIKSADRLTLSQLDTPALARDIAAVKKLVATDPQSARELVVDSLLGRWARSIKDGDSIAASRVADMSLSIGETLVALVGDSSTVHLAAAVHRTSATSTKVSVADAVAAGVEGTRLFRATEYQHAESSLTAAITVARAHHFEALADWFLLSLGGVRIAEASYRSAETIFVQVAARAHARNDIAIEARALWGLALSRGRRGDMSDAELAVRAALSDFTKIGETSNRAFLNALVADIYVALGRPRDVADATFAALDAFHRRPDPPLQFAVFLALGQRLSQDGRDRAALVAIREAVHIAQSTGRVKDLAEARARLAAAEAMLGMTDDAATEIAAARARADSVSDPSMHDRLDADLARFEAAILAERDPRRAENRQNVAVRYFERAGILTDYAPALVRRAQLKLRLLDSSGAIADLDTASRTVRRLLPTSAGREPSRLVVNTQRAIYRQSVELALARRDTMAAYRFARLSKLDTLVSDDALLTRTDPSRDDAKLEYLLYRDRLLVWTTTHDGTRLTSVAVDSSAVASSIYRFEDLLRRGDTSSKMRQASAHLFALVITPVRSFLDRHVHRLTIVPDGPLARLPFAALAASPGHYLVDDFSIVYSVRGQTPRKTVAVKPRVDRVVLIGNPAFDQTRFLDLDDLPGAESEVIAIDSIYPGAQRLSGAAATRARTVRGISNATLLHFAGHARVARDEPSASHLVLAKSDSTAGDVMFARDIARARLDDVHVVVLSACGSSDNTPARPTSNGLVEAFLDAGAGLVVASQWEAGDLGTAALMRDFHRRLATGLDPAEALRRTQRAALVGAGASVTFAWSAFRVYTR